MDVDHVVLGLIRTESFMRYDFGEALDVLDQMTEGCLKLRNNVLVVQIVQWGLLSLNLKKNCCWQFFLI